ncbi:MAG: ABC transporter permease [Rhizobiaceae bacterium]
MAASETFPTVRPSRYNRRLLVASIMLTALAAVAALAPYMTPFDPLQQHLRFRLLPPGSTFSDGRIFLLGTDQFGRDAFSRLLVGARVPLLVATSGAVLGGAIGLFIGVIAGYFGGWVDTVIGIAIDAQLSLPFVLVGMMVVVLFGANAVNIILAFTLLSWPIFARIARDVSRLAARRQFVEASALGGGTHWWIITRHIVPAALPRIIVVASIQLAYFVVSESAFGFFGLGVPPPQPTWGNMLADSRSYIAQAWWLGVFPGIAIALIAFSANLLANGLNEVLDAAGTRKGLL